MCLKIIVRKIVIYGFPEYLKEHSSKHDRLLQMFYELLNVDGIMKTCTESANIVRHKNQTRSLVLDLLSKKMTKYVLNNSYCFRVTKLSISKFLDKTALQDRKDDRRNVNL